MDYRLRRNPDGTVNAQPGDAVEYAHAIGGWVGATYAGIEKGVVKGEYHAILMQPGTIMHHSVPLEHVRHARGGAGWHRLREARLRAALEKLLDRETRLAELVAREDSESLDYWRGINAMMYVTANSARAALADLDSESAETEA